METNVQPQKFPEAINRLVDILKDGSGPINAIAVLPAGTSQDQTQKKYTICLVSKVQSLGSLLQFSYVDFLRIDSKRSGAHVKTVIEVMTNQMSHLISASAQ
jgi:hypothetical protein